MSVKTPDCNQMLDISISFVFPDATTKHRIVHLFFLSVSNIAKYVNDSSSLTVGLQNCGYRTSLRVKRTRFPGFDGSCIKDTVIVAWIQNMTTKSGVLLDSASQTKNTKSRRPQTRALLSVEVLGPWNWRNIRIPEFLGAMQKRIQGALGVQPPGPKISSKSCSFQAILRETPYFEEILGSGPPIGVQTPLAPPDQNPRSAPCVLTFLKIPFSSNFVLCPKFERKKKSASKFYAWKSELFWNFKIPMCYSFDTRLWSLVLL